MRIPIRILCVLFAILFIFQSETKAQNFTYSNEPLLSVISDIEKQTPYRFLYREALISDIKITLTANQNSVLEKLMGSLREQNIGLKVDSERFQALVYATSEQQESQRILITGYVLDANTGERLPYSTISWRDQGELFGISSTPSGTFTITTNTDSKKLSFLVSFVGYKPQIFALSFQNDQVWKDVSIRLEPEPFSGKEILIKGVNFYNASDTVLSGMIKVGAFSPLGETNAVRSLQILPSVSLSSAVNDGINIRGSASDGFQVLLDGQTVYHQSHLFGLLDAMNPDVLKTSGFYYDVTPAQFQAPLGGTLSLITRTGSLNKVQGSVGISNTATKATLEGPLAKGTSSWLVSGRISLMDEINWMNNQKLIEYGLDVNRPADIFFNREIPGRLIEEITLNDIEVQNTDARFYDLHSKIHFETKNGNQLSVSGYIGYDDASQQYLRDQTDVIQLYETTNEWQTNTISVNYNAKLTPNTYSVTNLGFSDYGSKYSKGDFEYPTRRQNNNNNGNRNAPDSSIIAELTLENSLQDFSVKQSFFSSFDGYSMEYGLSYSNLDVEYIERSIIRSSFLSRRTSQLVDVFHQVDITSFQNLNLNFGNRIHYFSNGRYLRWSPRIKAEFFTDRIVSFGAGFSRNYQFLNRLQFYNINSSDFWILTNEDQPPSAVNYYSAELKLRYFENTYLQVEGYLKNYENLRFHELNTGLVSTTFRNDEVPWFFENSGLGKGVEFLVKNKFGALTLNSSYALSSIQLKNEQINDGEYFYAEWDRRHQFSFVSELALSRHFDFFISWMYGSGAPNRLNLQQQEESPRLPAYSRVDATLSYSDLLKSGKLKASFSIYNILDRKNPWYTEVKQITVETRNRNIQASARTNVFDLGIQPSFNVGYYF
ncbi:MAG: TonB-dependent receptor [Balneolaceae bacterium]|nr:TonB-dependent receptor [Balneolaceae bacterium]MBO6547322.1 TonB-dependent receptor [Balneolaceae bacterium]MBO6647731.1 TonB-dependent receptor [Balneolaceae bacterium]